MPDLINVCQICNTQFMLRDDFLEHLTKEHGVSEKEYGGIANEYKR